MKETVNEIGVIILRSFKHMLADKWAYIFSSLISLGIILAIGFGIDTFVQTKSLGVSFTEFFGPSYLPLMICWGGIAIGTDLIRDKRGFIRLLLVAPVSKYSILFGLILSGILSYLITLPLVIVIFLIYIKSLFIAKLVLSLLLTILIGLGFSGLGLFLGSLFKKEKNYELFMAAFDWGIFALSGAFYPIKNLPYFLKILVSLNPLSYSVDAMRYVLVGVTSFGIFTDLVVLFIFSFISIILGTYLFDKNLRR